MAYVADQKGNLLSFELPELTAGKEQALEGSCAWGPRRIGKYVLLATDKKVLYCMGDAQERVWQQPLRYGPLAGDPLSVGEHLLLAGRSGIVWRASAATGEELGKVDAAVPLGTGPVLLGEHMYVGSVDGCLYEVKRP